MRLPSSFHFQLQNSDRLHDYTIANKNVTQFSGLFPELSMVDLCVLALSIIHYLLSGWRSICVNLRLRELAGRDLVIEKNIQLFISSAFNLGETEVRPDKRT
jgi:hypothetical protein